MEEPDLLLSLSRPQLLNRLINLTREITGLQRELGLVRAQERRLWIQGFLNSPETTVTARQRDGDMHALEMLATGLEVQAQLDALVTEADVLRLLLEDVK